MARLTNFHRPSVNVNRVEFGKGVKGAVRVDIMLPKGYGEVRRAGSVTFRNTPDVQTTVYKDRFGHYLVIEKGGHLDVNQKRQGFKKTRDKMSRILQDQFRKNPHSEVIIHKEKSHGRGGSRKPTVWDVTVNKERGVIGENGQFTPVDEFGKNSTASLLDSIDHTQFAIDNYLDMKGWYMGLDAVERGKVREALVNFDWDGFFEEFIDSDGKAHSGDPSKQKAGIDSLLDTLSMALGRPVTLRDVEESL